MLEAGEVRPCAASLITPPVLVSNQYSASSSISCVHRLEELDAFVFGTENTSIDGFQPHAMLMFDLHVVDSAAAPVMIRMAISTTSAGLLEPNEACDTQA
jgi:hypothetical protein